MVWGMRTSTYTGVALRVLDLAHVKGHQAAEALTATVPSRHRPSAALADRLGEGVTVHCVNVQLLAELEPWVALADELDVDGGPIDEVTDEQAQDIIQVAQEHARRAAFHVSTDIPDPLDPRDVADTVAALCRRAGAAGLVDALAGLGVPGVGYRLTAAQAAARAGVGAGTWRAYVARDQAPASTGDGWLSSEVDEWIARRPGRGSRTDLRGLAD